MKKLIVIAMIALMAGMVGSASATLYTNFTGSATAPGYVADSVTRVQNTLDFTATPAAISDIYQVIGVPSNTIVLAVGYDVITTNTASSTFEIGDGSHGSRFATNCATATKGGVLASGTAYLYAADDTIDVQAIAALANGKVLVWAVFAAPPKK